MQPDIKLGCVFVTVDEAKSTVNKKPDPIGIPLCEKNEIIRIIGKEENYTVYVGLIVLKDLIMFVSALQRLYRDNGLDGPWIHFF